MLVPVIHYRAGTTGTQSDELADELAKRVTLGESDRRAEIVSVVEHDVFSAEQMCSINNEPPSWMDPIIIYL